MNIIPLFIALVLGYCTGLQYLIARRALKRAKDWEELAHRWQGIAKKWQQNSDSFERVCKEQQHSLKEALRIMNTLQTNGTRTTEGLH